MEPITNLITMPGLKGFENLQAGSSSYDNASQNEIDNYLDRLFLVVADSFRLSSQNPTDEEKALRADSWARALMGIVPEGELDRTFKRAFKDHASTFPVSAYDMKAAYERMIAEEQQAAESRRRQLIAEAQAASRLPDYRVCESCFDTGFRQVDDPQGGPYKGVVRCNHCRYWPIWREKNITQRS